MRWLRPLSARASTRLDNESGVTIIFIAVVLLGLLAMTAFVIDFGRIWQERRELQAGATAAAFAVAEDCARDLCDAFYNENLVADLYADANATDAAAAIHGNVALDLAGQTVEVVTATEEPDGSASMDMFFARIVGFDTITVGAGAIVEWGTPLYPATIPLVFSECEWEHPAEGEDPDDWIGWPNGDPSSLPLYSIGDVLNPDQLVTISFHQGITTEPCNAVAGQDANGDGMLSGGFGWLDSDGSCTSQVYDDAGVSWVNADSGSSPSTGCGAAALEDLLFGGPVAIPYFLDIDGIGANGRYLVENSTAFVVAGYNFGGQYKEYRSPLTALPCGGATRCLAGWFVKHVDNGGTGGPLGGSDRGVIVIQLIG